MSIADVCGVPHPWSYSNAWQHPPSPCLSGLRPWDESIALAVDQWTRANDQAVVVLGQGPRGPYGPIRPPCLACSARCFLIGSTYESKMTSIVWTKTLFLQKFRIQARRGKKERKGLLNSMKKLLKPCLPFYKNKDHLVVEHIIKLPLWNILLAEKSRLNLAHHTMMNW